MLGCLLRGYVNQSDACKISHKIAIYDISKKKEKRKKKERETSEEIEDAAGFGIIGCLRNCVVLLF